MWKLPRPGFKSMSLHWQVDLSLGRQEVLRTGFLKMTDSIPEECEELLLGVGATRKNS